MIDQEREDFGKAWTEMSELLPGKPPSTGAIDLAFRVLKNYSLVEVLTAMQKNLSGAKWMPTPAEIIELIDVPVNPVGQWSSSSLYSLAAEAKTPLGVLVRYQVTSFTIDSRPLPEALAAISAHRHRIDQLIADYCSGQLDEDATRVLRNRKMLNRGLCEFVVSSEPVPRLESNDGPVDPRVMKLANGIASQMPVDKSVSASPQKNL